jgi:hypothetical protein
MWYFEEGMIAQITQCETQVIYNVPLVYLEFDCTGYINYNKQYERMIYYTDDMTEQRTATDMGLQRTKEYAYFASNTNFTEWFHLVTGKFWEEYLQSKPEHSYVTWLEQCLYNTRYPHIKTLQKIAQ